MTLLSYSVYREIRKLLLPECRRCLLCRTLTSTHYEVLGLGMNASKDEIRNKFLELTKKHHPDVNGNSSSSHEKFTRISDAYNVLSSPLKRKNYDRELMASMHFQNRLKKEAYANRPFTYTHPDFYEKNFGRTFDSNYGYHERNDGKRDRFHDLYVASNKSSFNWMLTRMGICCLLLILYTLPVRYQLKKDFMAQEGYLEKRKEIFGSHHSLEVDRKPDVDINELKRTSGIKLK